nr:aspyridones efflux protein apdf [Quercus suber]
MDEKPSQQVQHEEPRKSTIPKSHGRDAKHHPKEVLLHQSYPTPSDGDAGLEDVDEPARNNVQLRMDGGRDAWGLSNAYGVFQTYYSTSLIPTVSPTSISWIGSIQSFLTGFTAVFGGYLIDSGRHREIMVLATFLEVFGMMMTSLGTKYWHFLLAQGICVGLGSGMFAVTSPAVLASYFKRRRLLAGGIASTGGGIGLFNTSTRTSSGVLLTACSWGHSAYNGTETICGSGISLGRKNSWLLHARSSPGSIVGHQASSERKTIRTIAASLAERACIHGIRICYGAINILIPCVTGTAIVGFCWRESHTLAGLIVVAVAWAATSASLISLPPLGIANLVDNPAEYGTRIGLAYTISAFGALLGNPIAAAARAGNSQPSSRSAAQREYQGTWFVAAGAATIAAMLLLYARYKLVGFRLRVKV